MNRIKPKNWKDTLKNYTDFLNVKENEMTVPTLINNRHCHDFSFF